MAYRIGIVGVTGAVGQELLALMAKRNFPVAELRPWLPLAPQAPR